MRETVTALAFAALACAADQPASWKFDFSAGHAPPAYSKEIGFGFDLGTISGTGKPFFFSVNVPEGNYNVTVTLGDPNVVCVTTVKAESRRLMLERVRTGPGEFEARTFTVNVRNSRLTPPPRNAPGGDQVRLNPREQGALQWDDKLTLEFNDQRPCVAAIEITKAEVPTIFLAGDSTVTDQAGELYASWGQMITRFFKPGIAVANHAESGETLKSFITGLRLDKILSQMKKGDYLLIQFGHNDMKESWPQTYAEASTTYKAYLHVLIAEARRRGATPVLITPMHRRNFDGNASIVNTLGDYPDAMRQTAKEEAVPLIDLNAMSAVFYEALGPLRAPVAFAAGGRDSTHHSSYGAYELAKCVVQGIRDSKLELAAYLADVQPFDPAHPDPVPASYRFDFGSGPAAPGYTKVIPATLYSDDLGYGFEPGSSILAVDRSENAPGKGDFITSEKPPFYFSVKVPEEGNYRVTVQLGDRAAESVTTVKAELRRLMLERVHTAPGQVETRSFIVNTRTPQIVGGGEVRLKDREKASEAWAWDNRITMEFTDTHPAVGSVEVEKADGIPTIYIAGDSTSTDQGREPFNSWGQMLTRFFKPEIAIANHGESGESLKSYVGEKRLAKVMSVIKPGDWLFIQMGHNDQKLTAAGVGAFTTYKAALKQFIAEARQHGATPVLITPMHRLTFDSEGKIVNSLGDYPEAVRQTAKEENVALIDLNAMSKSFYEALGPEQGHLAFAGKDTTHHSDYGSYELAKCIVQGIKDANLQLMKYLVEMPTFDPAQPDPVEKFDVPAEPLGAIEKPYGR